jgi:hypothetical protein
MDLGFETVGNATLVCHDKRPILVTDPWIVGTAYFGSWGRTHEIPAETLETIRNCEFVWLSHGHPDHLSPRSFELLQGKKFLLPDHVGGRIFDGLKERGFDVTVMRERRWYLISDRIRVLSIADYNQDAILLVDLGGNLIVDLNDASDRGWGGDVKRAVAKHKVSFLLQQPKGLGNADMLNLWREDGTFIEPAAARRRPIGRLLAGQSREFGTRFCVPFSSMHRFQRADSAWAQKYRINLSDYPTGFESRTTELLPAFIRYDAARDTVETLNPLENKSEPADPCEFGDNWSEPLEPSDGEKITRYFKEISHLQDFLDFIRVRVGGKEHMVELAKSRFDQGLSFEAPRNSLMTAIENEIFDDVLNGNFMKTTIHGKEKRLLSGPDFSPYVAKYADNGRAKSKEELDAYFKQYMMRAPLAYLKHRIAKRSTNLLRFSLNEESQLFRLGARTYFWLSGRGFSY